MPNTAFTEVRSEERFPEFSAFLTRHQQRILESIVADLRQRSRFYAEVPLDQLTASAQRLLDLLTASLVQGDGAPFLDVAIANFERRLGEGITIDEALYVPFIFRSEIIRLALTSGEPAVTTATSGLLFAMTILDAMELRTVSTFRDRIGQLETLVNNALDGVLVYDLNGAITYANRALTQAIGHERAQQLIGQQINDLIAPEDRVRLPIEVDTALAESGGWQGQLWALRTDGSRWLAQISLFRLSDSAGEKRGHGVITRDVTEIARQSQERLRLLIDLERQTDELQRFRALVENATEGVVVVSLDGQVIYFNQAFASLTRFGDEMIGAINTKFFREEDQPRLRTAVALTLEHGTWQGELNYMRGDGSAFQALVTMFLIRDRSGQPQSRGVFVRDMTDLLRAQEEREALQQEVIMAQELAIRELSSPLIPLADGVVAMPLVGTISTARAQQIMETLLEGIGRYQADVALIDITGVRVVDTQVADSLLRAARAARLLGTQVVLTGIGAEIAQTLVGLGADLTGITTRGTLREGIAFGMQQVEG
jgi:rsbT co-antagonist protein RsbR